MPRIKEVEIGHYLSYLRGRMLKLNRTTEYGLIALRHISRKYSLDPNEVTSAREIADSYELPFEATAKTLQKLKDSGLIQSAHGAKGGYTLSRPLNEISVAEFLQLMEGPQALVLCSSPMEQEPIGHGCEYQKRCEIKQFMNQLNSQIFGLLSGTMLSGVQKHSVEKR